MKRRREGFTIIELVVVISVMTILMLLVVARFLFTESSGRDQERLTDSTTIAKGLEISYQNGSYDGSIPKGYYPGTTQVTAAKALSPPFTNFLEGVSSASLTAPLRTITTSFGTDATSPGTVGNNADGSYDDTQAKALLATYPFLYQPLKRNNTLCANYVDCVKFNLYYQTETDSVIQRIRSKNQ